jgi:hypothetical protein
VQHIVFGVKNGKSQNEAAAAALALGFSSLRQRWKILERQRLALRQPITS